jgi:hypothetical protein
MPTFEYQQIIIIGTKILRRFEPFSHNDLCPDESLQFFTLGTEILNKCSYVCSISNVDNYLY